MEPSKEAKYLRAKRKVSWKWNKTFGRRWGLKSYIDVHSITVARNYAGYSPLDIFIKDIVRFRAQGDWRTKAKLLWKRYYFKRDGQL